MIHAVVRFLRSQQIVTIVKELIVDEVFEEASEVDAKLSERSRSEKAIVLFIGKFVFVCFWCFF